MTKMIGILFLLLLSSVNAFAREVTLTHKAVIENINLEDQTVTIVEGTYRLAPETRVVTKDGQLVSVSSLQKGSVVEFIMDDKSPQKKTITQIKILSDVPKELILR